MSEKSTEASGLLKLGMFVFFNVCLCFLKYFKSTSFDFGDTYLYTVRYVGVICKNVLAYVQKKVDQEWTPVERHLVV